MNIIMNERRTLFKCLNADEIPSSAVEYVDENSILGYEINAMYIPICNGPFSGNYRYNQYDIRFTLYLDGV